MKKILKSEFSRNVFILMTGSTISQILPIALTPVLTRLISPEEFGVYTFYMAIITFVFVISSGRYEQAIVLPKKDTDAVNILALCFLILSSITILLYLILFCFEGIIIQWMDIPELNSWLWFLPVCVFFVSSYKIFTYWSNRKKRFKGTSQSLITQTSSRFVTQMAAGVEKYNVLSEQKNVIGFFSGLFDSGRPLPKGITPIGLGGLIVSYAVGFFLGFVVLLIPFLRKDRGLLKQVSWVEIKNQAKIHEKFPKINSLHAMGDEFKNMGVTSTILYAFGDTILGFYSMTFRLLSAPLSVIGNSFAQVFYQKAAEMHANKENYVPLINKTVKRLALLALPIFAVIVFLGPSLFSFALGEKWRVAGEYAQYLTPWIFMSFVVSPVQQVAIIVNKQEKVFALSLVHNAIILGSILIGAYFANIVVGFSILSVLSVVFFGYYLWWIKSIAKTACSNFQE